MVKFKTPRGTRDFLPRDMIKREWIFSVFRRVFGSYGFDPLETPAFEDWKLLSAKGGGGDEIKDEIYYFRDKSKRELGLRFEFTVSGARVVANNPQIPKPFKRYQIGPVWRYDRPQAGRFREFWQADSDIVGSSGMECEAEILALSVECLRELGFRDFVIRINNRKILSGIVEALGIKNQAGVFRALDKFEKLGRKEFEKELKKAAGAKAGKLLNALEKGPGSLKSKLIGEGLNELREISKMGKGYGITKYIKTDYSLIRGLDYYTGPIFEVFIKGFENLGSVAGGGRYDKLIGLFGGGQTPAVGISFGIERIFSIMQDKKMFKLSETNTRVFVVPVNEKLRKKALKAVQELRKAGIPSQTDLMGRNIRKQLEYVNSMGIPYAIFLGPREAKSGKLTLRDMKTGKESSLKISGIIKRLK